MRNLTMTERELQNFKRKLRRQREIRRKIIISTFTLSIIIVLMLSFHTIITKANTDMDMSFKYYTNIMIEYGDTLWNIADNYIDDEFYQSKQAYVNEVMSINHLQDENVKSGQYIVVPYYASDFK